jgi:cystathionine beta-lyase
MKYLDHFNKTVDRTGLLTVKTDLLTITFGEEAKDAISMWVADCDYGSPSFVFEALKNRMQSPLAPYTMHGEICM